MAIREGGRISSLTLQDDNRWFGERWQISPQLPNNIISEFKMKTLSQYHQRILNANIIPQEWYFLWKWQHFS
jgi:hypothetical protein